METVFVRARCNIGPIISHLGSYTNTHFPFEKWGFGFILIYVKRLRNNVNHDSY